MSLDSCFGREIQILDRELEEGNITQQEYDKAERELELEAGDYEQEQIRRYDL